ncbi:hypothetical protein J437_LFUL007798 [Ladona fulva]|uniref:Nondiscriminating glutamyl-tRNA synthetase EARS2, mitochondrial n=1 Tax=Ladona fulva TaxID=123851 RepID=A0A8K0JSL9_LADFU|nr:hypothetical protein J437_LFUL007798 [Ladona fulva]
MTAIHKFCRSLYCSKIVLSFPRRFKSNIIFHSPKKSISEDKGSLVRVRFAPSPTGLLHLGSIRTALYNYLFAKSCGGKFILRIEDTDQSRIVHGAMEQLEEDLEWIGLKPDEGPTHGGPYGPYIQSQRLDTYKDVANELIDRKAAYMCFCTEYRLDLLRRDALRRRQVPRYDNRCRYLDPDEAKKRSQDGEKYCIRFKMDGMEKVTFSDIIYGTINFGASEEGDPVILKADGFPTYHLANIVDDHNMRISHVLRGVEWQVSTPKHILLYRALGWDPPFYAHLPLILNADGSKLSKRQGDIQVGYYRDNGIFPAALLNYVTDAGGGFPNRDRNVSLTLEDLISHFDISRVGSNSCRLQPDRLPEFNRRELKRLLQSEASTQQLVQKIQDMVKKKFSVSDGSSQLDLHEEHIRRILLWGSDRIHCLQDLVSPDFAFLWVRPLSEHKSEDKGLIEKLSAELMDLPSERFRKDVLRSILKEFSEKNGVTFGQFMKLIRHTISGLKDGPGVAEMLELLVSIHDYTFKSGDEAVARPDSNIDKCFGRLNKIPEESEGSKTKRANSMDEDNRNVDIELTNLFSKQKTAKKTILGGGTMRKTGMIPLRFCLLAYYFREASFKNVCQLITSPQIYKWVMRIF